MSLGPVDAARIVLAAEAAGEAAAIVTVVSGGDDAGLGRRIVVAEDAVHGLLAPAELHARAVEAARSSPAAAAPALCEVEVEGLAWTLYIEPHRPQPELLIVGAGHIARPLSRFASQVGFSVTIIDDRSEFADPALFPEARAIHVVDFTDPFRDVRISDESFVVLVTRAHEYDYEVIRELLRTDVRPAYLGMIGSRRRVRAAFEALLAEGIDPSRLERVRAPIGLDLGAETPEEIALAIVAELVAARRGGSGTPLKQREDLLKRTALKRAARREERDSDG